MTEKSRNFRTSYYDKVGFRGVEEQKALKILVNEKPMDKDKLSKFCLRFTIPSMYREYVWNVLLGVLSTNSECHESVMKQRSLHYEDLVNSLKIMHKIDENTSKPTIHTLMYLMTVDILEFNIEEQMTRTDAQNLVALASFFLKLSSSEITSYFLFKNFVLHQKKLNCNFKVLVENLESNLKREDTKLYEHMKNINAFETLPLKTWFERCYAEMLHHSSLGRVCDKVIGGSCKILPYVAIAMLMIQRDLLLRMDTVEDIVQLLEKNSEEMSDDIVNKALDMYLYYS